MRPGTGREAGLGHAGSGQAAITSFRISCLEIALLPEGTHTGTSCLAMTTPQSLLNNFSVIFR